MNWVFLLFASAFEVAFTTTFRLSENFRHLVPTIGFFACLLCSLFFLQLAIRSIPLGTAYAIWTGTGAIGTVVAGMIWFGEPAGMIRIGLILVIVAATIALKFA
ncbi:MULTISPECIES: DMT family transporter [Sphingosinicellaceae]|uniref:DMT family transporter n=1 Tax=Sphingosinicellaceae TaxID=2820280 RepID=UPI001C1E45FF|nr:MULTISPECIES: multidrug efflux SMR transporter [Polymorphobacter]QYE35626.1 multidrug efflux SMR transporter [Polymorphobacter sp. PAMC 29334]UAJ11939.1 multidrug efflux SMR transporter [Polymorphobacter megasporae]